MHDLDRTMQEMEFEDEFESYDNDEFEFDDEFEFEDEFEFDDEDEFEFDDEFEFEYDDEISISPFSEEEEMELATELLSITSEEELDQFLGGLVKKAWRGVKKFGKSKLWKGIKKGLRGVAKVALPVVGKAAGTFFGGPLGGAVGGKLGSWASRLFEMELEGLSPEDQEFEIAKRFVRLAGATAMHAAKAPSSAPVGKVVKVSIKKAAKKHAPGLLKQPSRLGQKNSGRWRRRGNRIFLFGI